MVAYDGSGFRGFANQPGVPTVAGALSAAIGRAARMPESPRIVCAGRTDAGVHAQGQVVHVDLPDPLITIDGAGRHRPMPAGDLQRAVNAQVSPAIVVRTLEEAPPEFDARHSAVSRSYRYLVHAAPVADPLLAPYTWHVPGPLDVRAMGAATDPLIGEHDFRAFCRRRPGTDAGEPIVRSVSAAGWTEVPGVAADGRLYRFDIVAGSFCHQMVRSLVGTLVSVGRGKGNAATVMKLLRSGSRNAAPEPAPPHGLCLVSVSYGGRRSP